MCLVPTQSKYLSKEPYIRNDLNLGGGVCELMLRGRVHSTYASFRPFLTPLPLYGNKVYNYSLIPPHPSCVRTMTSFYKQRERGSRKAPKMHLHLKHGHNGDPHRLYSWMRKGGYQTRNRILMKTVTSTGNFLLKD